MYEVQFCQKGDFEKTKLFTHRGDFARADLFKEELKADLFQEQSWKDKGSQPGGSDY